MCDFFGKDFDALRKDAGISVGGWGSKNFEGNGNFRKTKKIFSNYVCCCETTMLTSKIIKEIIENLFQFDFDKP